ncbi:MAG: MG2 domain-containing protein, partial [Bacteroidales bacterium]|nr:MG2 domain-containing protein [Bacteroidales bacterium]
MIRPEKITVICTLVAAFLLLATAFFYAAHAYQDNKNKTITELWDQFRKSESADKPKTSLEILDKIKTYALEKHLSWDYYDACNKYFEVTSRINWKQRQDAASKLKAEIERLDDPVVVSYYYLNAPYGYRKSYNDIYKYAQDNKTRLSATSSQKFLQNVPWSKLSDVIREGHFFKNDYQNLLWILTLNGHKESLEELKKEYDGVYPQGAWLEYYELAGRRYLADEKTISALKKYAEKYSSKAMSLFAKEDLLQNKFYDMESDRKTTSSQYKALRQECKEFIDLKNTFSKTEKNIASCSKEVESLIENLDYKRVEASISDNVLSAVFKNTSSVNVSLEKKDSKKTVWSTTVKNNINSYYVNDTIKVDIPDIDDGEYTLKYRRTEKETIGLQYSRYSISVATRVNNNGRYEIYAADSRTGEPLESVSGIKLDGFTFIGADNQTRLENNVKETFVCKATSKTGKVLLSKELTRNDFVLYFKPSVPIEDRVSILTSAPAYHPGDVIDYKIIAYSSKRIYGDKPEMNVLSNQNVKVELRDVEGKLVEEQTLLTNEFGSAASSFTIPTDRKNGTYSLKASHSGLDCGYEPFIVCEYVLPSFVVTIDKIEGTVFVGETITFKGKVKSYSGKSVSADKSTYSLTTPKGSASSGRLEVDPEGNFSVNVEATEECNYSFTVNIVDATGESKTARTSLYVSDNVYFRVRVLNGSSAEAVPITPPSGIMPIYRPYRRTMTLIDTSDVVAYFSYSNNSGIESPATVDYTVYRDGKKVASGQAPANEKVTIALDSSESGQYSIEAVAHVTSKEGKTVTSQKETTEFVKVLPEASSIDFPIEYIIIPSKDGIGFRIGTTNGDIWSVVSVVSSDGKILKDDAIHIEGKRGEKGSIIDVKYDAESSWSESIQVNLCWFKNHSFQSWNKTFDVPKKEDPFKVEFSSFTDRTTPSKTTEFTLKVPTGSETAVSVYDKALETISRLRWWSIDKGSVQMVPLQVGSTCGSNSTSYRIMYKSVANGAVSKSAARIPTLSDAMDIVDDDVLVMNLSRSEGLGVEVMDYVEEVNEEAIVEEVNDDVNLDEINLRDSFDEVIAFEPFLYPDENGNVTFTVTPAGKLSTFIVKTYTHDKSLSSVVSEKELVVSIPVELSIAEPQFLYVGDKYVLNAAVSANSGVSVKTGTMTLTVFDGKDRSTNPIYKTSKSVRFDANGLASASFEIASVPECRSGELGLMVTFSGKNDNGESISDGALVSVPVYRTEKMMTESHSAVYRPGMDKDAVISILSSQFTNLSSRNAVVSERKIADLIAEVLDDDFEPKGDDAISLMEAIQVRMLSAKLSGKSADCS